jgi:hypothetical protein
MKDRIGSRQNGYCNGLRPTESVNTFHWSSPRMRKGWLWDVAKLQGGQHYMRQREVLHSKAEVSDALPGRHGSAMCIGKRGVCV